MSIITENNVTAVIAPTDQLPAAAQLDAGTFVFDTTRQALLFNQILNGTRSLVEINGAASLGWFSVKDYGAKGDGSTDDTVAIQAAVTAIPSTGGVLYFPPGYYYISSAIVLKNYVHVTGVGPQATRIRQTVASENAFIATDSLYVTIEQLTIIGPGGSTGNGLYFRYVSQVTSYLTLRSLNIQTFGGDGVKIDRIIASTVDKVISQGNLGNGFSVLNGTSVNFISCFALSCNQSGYYLDSVNYATFTGTSTDNCGLGYRFIGCRTISVNGCGVEECRNINSTYNGTGLIIDSCIAMTINGLENVDNAAIGFYVTGSSSPVTLNCIRENSPTINATISLKIDTGCNVTLISPLLVTATSIAAGTTRFPSSTVFAVKTANEIVNNSNVLQNDDVLLAAVSANATYLVELWAIYDSSTVADIQFAFTGPSGATLDWTTNSLGTAAAGATGSITVARSTIAAGGALPAGGVGVGTQLIANARGILIVGTTAGNLQLQWAQNTADATDTTVRARSWLRLIRVA